MANYGQFTSPPDTRAVGSGNPPADMNSVVDMCNAMGSFLNVLNGTYGTVDPNGVSGSANGINNALTAAALWGVDCFIPAGIYRLDVPVIIPPATSLRGAVGTDLVASVDTGTVLMPSQSFSAGGWPWTAAVMVVDATTGGYAVTSQEEHCQNIMIDGSNVIGNAYTATHASPAVFTVTGSNYTAGQRIVLTGGSVPTGFSNNTIYYVVNPTTNTFQLSATSGGSAINSSTTGNGTATQIVDGITLYSGASNIGQMHFNTINIVNMTGTGFSVPNGSGHLRLFNVHVRSCVLSSLANTLIVGGFQLQCSDSEWLYCGAYNCTGTGMDILNSSDTFVSNIHVEHCGPYQFHYKSTLNNATINNGCITFMGLSDDAGTTDGFYIESSAAGATPVNIIGGFFRGPGTSSGSSGYAAIHVNAYQGPVTITNVQVNSRNGSPQSPQYAVSATNCNANSSFISINGGTYIGISSAFNTDGTCAAFTVSGDTVFGTGNGTYATGLILYCPGVTLQAANGQTELIPQMEILYSMPSGTLFTTNRRDAITGTFSPATGQVYVHLVYLVAGVPITNLVLPVAGTGKTGGSHAWQGLIQVSTSLVVAVTADATDAATTYNATNTPQAQAIHSANIGGVTTTGVPYIPPYSGYYWHFFCIVATGMPTIGGVTNNTSAGMGAQAPIWCGTGPGGQTTPIAVGTSVTPASVSADSYAAWGN